MVQLINALTPLHEARAILAESFELKFTKAVQKATARVFDKVKDRIPEIEWPFFAPLIFEINRQKKEKDAVILAHNYQTPQIYHGVADIVGDSLQLAIEAGKVKQSTIVQCGKCSGEFDWRCMVGKYTKACLSIHDFPDAIKCEATEITHCRDLDGFRLPMR